MAANTVTFVAILSIVVVYLASNKEANAVSGSVQFTVGAFNIENFGPTKVENGQVLAIIVQILSRYDVVLVQELRDKKGTDVVPKLMDQLNKRARSAENYSYKYVMGPPLPEGKPRQEEYAYIYRECALRLVDSYTYPDPSDDFVRDPFVAVFETTSRTKLGRFALVGIHTPPDRAVEEMQHLHEVAEHVTARSRQFATQNIILMGDFNAGTPYATPKWLSTVTLYADADRFTWLIGDKAKTTLGGKAHDRIVVTNNEMKSSVVAGSARAFEFDKSLPNYPTDVPPKTVSDHYPVEVKIASGLI